MTHRTRRRLGIAGILIGLVIAGIWVPSSAAAAGDQRAIEAVIRSRMDLMQGFGATSDGAISPQALPEALTKANGRLRSVYSGELLTQRSDQLDASLRAQAGGALRFFGGGVSKLTFSKIGISGSIARLTVTATTWSDVGQVVERKVVRSRPANIVEFTFELTRLPEGWRITQESFVFAPGSEP